MVFVIVFVFSFVLRLRRLFLLAGVMAVPWCAGGNFTINMLPQQPLLCDRIHHQRHSKEIFTFASVWSYCDPVCEIYFSALIMALCKRNDECTFIDIKHFVRTKAWGLLHLNSLYVTFTLPNYSRNNVGPRFLQRSPGRRQTLSPCSSLLLLASRSSPLLLRCVHHPGSVLKVHHPGNVPQLWPLPPPSQSSPPWYLGGDQPGPDLGVGDRQAEEEERPGHSDPGVKISAWTWEQ